MTCNDVVEISYNDIVLSFEMLRLDLCCDWIPVVATGYYSSRFLRLLKNNDIRTATEDDQQQLRNLFIVIHLRSGGSISCLNTQHDTWNSN
ncbi:dihydrolipoyl dehydrogenase 2, chloroplastic-like [Dorcoceras hygrometricum]|uniref:Dihydrolipoyl dehydrogenase 2, chloroplastic-like n=1 Tax=Dorcoceras hygrometricum TaxID=472368 RepID=A0A2Z6ZYD0_9LAMI|nr:dihydrolipoyl dehydrogenase 2, chloroplastic-like [Dorcoceras hygrometricum]